MLCYHNLEVIVVGSSIDNCINTSARVVNVRQAQHLCACHCFKECQRKSEQIEQILIKNVKSPKDSILLPAEIHLSKYKTQ